MNNMTRRDDERAAAEEEPIIHLEAETAEPIIQLEPSRAPKPAAVPGSRPGPHALSSTDADERRRALAKLMRGEMTDAEAERVSALVLDPQPDIRSLALEALERADRMKGALLHQALKDPSDVVRAAAVRMAAARGAQYLADVVPLAASRRWPMAQRAALELLPGLIRTNGGLWDRELSTLLLAIAQMPSPPLEGERAPFADLARAIGIGRLADSLWRPDVRRLGTVRLLLEEGSPPALGAVASLASDALEEVRLAAEAAAVLLAEASRIELTAAPAPGESEAWAPGPSAETQMIETLARVLQDPSQSVRDRAWAALAKVNWAVLLAWVRDSLRSGDPQAAAVSAHVAERLMLSQVAPAILARAAAAPPEARGPFIRALSSFALEPEALRGALAEVQVQSRANAVAVVWQIGGRAALPHLRSLLKDSYGPVRMAVLEAFGESRDPAAIEVARGVLASDSSSAARSQAVRLLGRAGREERRAALELALIDPHPDVRLAALEVLLDGLGAEAARPLLKAVNDPDERVSHAALLHVADLPEGALDDVWNALLHCHPPQRERLAEMLERTNPHRLFRLWVEHLHSAHHNERVLAIELSARAGTQDSIQAAIQAAIRALQDPAASVRRAAAAALSFQRNPAAADALGKALHDPDPKVRLEAVRALGLMDDEVVLDFLVPALGDPDGRVRTAAATVLTTWSSPAVARRLTAALSDSHLRQAAADLLSKMGPSAVEPLIDALPQEDPQIVSVAGEALRRIAGLEHFVERLGSMQPEQRLRAEEAVGAIGGHAAVEALVRMLADPDPPVRIRALRLLARLGDPWALEAVRRSAAGDPVPDVAAAAAETAARLAGGPA